MINNKVIKSLGHYKEKINKMNKTLKVYIQNNYWPFNNFVLKQELISLIEEIKSVIVHLKFLKKLSEALRFIEYFSFSLVNRFVTIESIRTRSTQNVFNIDKIYFLNAYDFVTCFYLVACTHPKNLTVKQYNLVNLHLFQNIKLKKKDVIEYIWQLQLFNFLNPLVDTFLPEHFYGCRKDRTALQAVAFLSTHIQMNKTFKYSLISLKLDSLLNANFYKFILIKFPFPTKYKYLLIRWIKGFCLINLKQKSKNFSNKSKGLIWAPIIYNFILAQVYENCFTSNLLKFLKLYNNKVPFIDFFLNFNNNILIKVTNRIKIAYFITYLRYKFIKLGLSVASEKVIHLDFNRKIKFNWLGYTFLVIPKQFLYWTKLIQSEKKYIFKITQKYSFIVLTFITNKNFKKIKKQIKLQIKQIKYKPILYVLKKINNILKKIILYYGFIGNSYRFLYLQFFIQKKFWNVLVEKFRFNGVRRPAWVAQTFFVSTKSPLGLKWHLHFSNLKKNLKMDTFDIFWFMTKNYYNRLPPLSTNWRPKI